MTHENPRSCSSDPGRRGHCRNEENDGGRLAGHPPRRRSEILARRQLDPLHPNRLGSQERSTGLSSLARSTGGAPAVKLTNGEKGETSPQWAPDGSKIAFLADRGSADSKSGNQIWLIRPDGGEAEKLTSEENPVNTFQFSPDGKHIAFITRDTPADKADREKKHKDKFDAILMDADYTYSHLWTIALSDKSKKRITEGAFSVSAPRWSPDSRSIAYVQSGMGQQESSWFDLNADRNSDIYVVSANGGAPKRMTSSPGPDTDPVWSPDGTELAYLTAMDPRSWAEKTDLVVIPAAGGTPRNLTKDFPDSATAIAW